MDTVFQNILAAGFSGSVVILAVVALRFILRPAPKKYVCMLWLLAVLRLLLPFRLESSLSLQPPAEAVTTLTQTEFAGNRALSPGMVPRVKIQQPQEPVISHGQTPDYGAEVEQPPVTVETVREAPGVNWRAAVPWVWLAVAASFGIYTIQGYLRLKRKVRFAVKIPGGWECEGIETAFILGYIKPKIYIPMGMSVQNRRHILAHERTHLEKGDHWIKLIAFLALSLHWFNPLVWLLYVLLCRDMEMSCDERVVRFMELEERKAYSAALMQCSASRAHYAACPIAFGEVGVKQRILSVLNYKKPRFWVSLLSILAVAFVAVTLVTSPREPEQEPAGESTPPDSAVEGGQPQTGFCSGLTVEQIADTCAGAMDALRYGHSYHITLDHDTLSTSDVYGSYCQTTDYYRHGDNYLAQTMEDGAMVMGFMEFEGQHGYSMGSPFILWSEGSWGSDGWLDTYAPGDKTLSFPEGTGVIGPDRVSYYAVWSDLEHSYEGTFTYVFTPEGTLSQVLAEFGFRVEDGQVSHSSVLTVKNMTEGEILAHMQAVADEAMDNEEYEAWQVEKETITEVPSNKTEYDRDFMLGSGSKQWKFFGEQGHVRIGAEELSQTGVTLVYSEAGDTHSSLTADQGFWLEQLVEGKWVVIGEYEAPQRSIQVSWTTADRYTLTWEEPLEGGFYRLGRYHTMTLEGEKEQAVCYAKFRLYDQEEKLWMDQANAAMEDLLNSPSYHIFCTEWNTQNMDTEYYITSEVWKHGADFLSQTRYIDRENQRLLHDCKGAMRRGGVCYELEWAGDTVSSPVASWSTNTYMTDFNFTMWSAGMEWHDGMVEQVTRQGNVILIQEYYDFDDRYEAAQTELTLNEEGSIVAMRRLYLPTRDCGEKDKVADRELTVLPDAGDAARMIQGQDLQNIPQFSWAKEQEMYPVGEDGVRSKGFVNTAAVTMAGTQDVVARALKDCTLPAAGGMEPGTNVSTVFFDPEEKIWKVEFTASWDSGFYQAVYLTEKGITVLTVTK